MANPTGKNQYSGGGKGGKLIPVKMHSTGGSTARMVQRDTVAKKIHSFRSAIKKSSDAPYKIQMKAFLSNYRNAGRTARA